MQTTKRPDAGRGEWLRNCKRIDSVPGAGDDKEKRPMIKPKRIGHATFETPDLEKAIAYYEKFMGLIVAEREKDRAFLASKVGPLVIQLNKADRAHCIK
jgi:catechol-2,3-dioxygenase